MTRATGWEGGGADVFAAIADPTRRSILDLLAGGPRSAGEIGARFPKLTQPGVSRHLRVLRRSGLVDVTPKAQRRVYAVRPERLSGLADWILQYAVDERDRLERLAAFVEGSRRRR